MKSIKLNTKEFITNLCYDMMKQSKTLNMFYFHDVHFKISKNEVSSNKIDKLKFSFLFETAPEKRGWYFFRI